MAIQVTEPGPQRTLDALNAPALCFDLDGEVSRLWDGKTARGSRNAKTLVKHPDFRLVLTVLKAGTGIHEHKASGRISIQTVQGHLRMHVRQGLENEPIDLPAGHLLVLDQGVPHDIEALADSAFLLTVAWPGERPQALSPASSAARVTVRRIRR